MGNSIYTNSSRTQSALLHKADRMLKRNNQPKSAITAAQHQDIPSSNHDLTNSRDELDDDLPSLKKLSQIIWPLNISTNALKTALQHPDMPALDSNSMPIDHTEPRLSSHQGDNRGSQDLLVINEDNEPDGIDAEDEAQAASDDVDAIRAQQDASPSSTLLNQDLTFGLSKSINPSALERWYTRLMPPTFVG